VLQFVAVCCRKLQCDAICDPPSLVTRSNCNVWQFVAVICSVLQCVAVRCSVLQCITECCRVLQCDATPDLPSPATYSKLVCYPLMKHSDPSCVVNQP